VPGDPVPADIRAMADARALARAERDWAEADRLRAAIEDAGWKVVDRGFSYRLSPAHPPDVVSDDVVRYGRSASVPSRLDAPSVGIATVVLVATDRPGDLVGALAALRIHAPAGTQVVVVADGPSHELESTLVEETARGGAGLAVDVIRTSKRLGPTAALNAGIRQAGASVVILLDTSAEPTGDIVTPLLAALEEPSVAVVGASGLVSADLRHFTLAAPGDVAVVDATCLAFRRADAASRGPLDERFHRAAGLATWWSLVLRDEGEGSAPRRAVALAGLPLARRETDAASPLDGHRDREERRDSYRILDRFGGRTDLLVPRARAAR
jgi:hypothetical protein